MAKKLCGSRDQRYPDGTFHGYGGYLPEAYDKVSYRSSWHYAGGVGVMLLVIIVGIPFMK